MGAKLYYPLQLLLYFELSIDVPMGTLIIASTLFFLALFQLVVALLWYFLGHYVIEVDDKSVRVGRTLFNYDRLRTFNTIDLYRIRFNPLLNVTYRRGYPTTQLGPIYIPGFFHLYLDYGLNGKTVMTVAIEKWQARRIRKVIHAYYAMLDSRKQKSSDWGMAVDSEQEKFIA